MSFPRLIDITHSIAEDPRVHVWRLIPVGIIGCSIWISGCGDTGATIQAVQQVVQASQGNLELEDMVDSDEELTDENDLESGSFEPVNADRTNPFEMPISDSGSEDVSAVAAQGAASVGQVVVLGFAKVGTPRVILRIGDQTRILGVGDRTMNVKVLRIEPPRVQLQMDNLTWMATMFDERAK